MSAALLTWPMFFQCLAGTTALLSVWNMGNKVVAGPVLGLLSQAAWLAMIFSNEAWGLLPFTLAMIGIQLRNLRKWLQERRAA